MIDGFVATVDEGIRSAVVSVQIAEDLYAIVEASTFLHLTLEKVDLRMDNRIWLGPATVQVHTYD